LGSDPVARGCLEFLWEFCYENGDDYLGDSDNVESMARWSGEPGILTKALLEAGSDGNAGFIEQSAAERRISAPLTEKLQEPPI